MNNIQVLNQQTTKRINQISMVLDDIEQQVAQLKKSNTEHDPDVPTEEEIETTSHRSEAYLSYTEKKLNHESETLELTQNEFVAAMETTEPNESGELLISSFKLISSDKPNIPYIGNATSIQFDLSNSTEDSVDFSSTFKNNTSIESLVIHIPDSTPNMFIIDDMLEGCSSLTTFSTSVILMTSLLDNDSFEKAGLKWENEETKQRVKDTSSIDTLIINNGIIIDGRSS